MKEIALEKIVTEVVKQVIQELIKQGVQVVTIGTKTAPNLQNAHFKTKVEQIDMSKYKTPVLTENHIRKLHELTGEVIIPEGTIITPRAKELIKERQIRISRVKS